MKFSRILFGTVVAILFFSKSIYSQQLSNNNGNAIRLSPKTLHSPSKAALRSAILPGWGQIYNKRWWKLPLVYGGVASLIWIYNFNNNYYKEFLTEAQLREEGKPGNPDYKNASDAGIIAVKDFYRRNRDLTILSMVAFWGINIIDAYVDAKFFQFDIGDDLSLRITPDFGSLYGTNSVYASNPYVGLSLKLNMKNEKIH